MDNCRLHRLGGATVDHTLKSSFIEKFIPSFNPFWTQHLSRTTEHLKKLYIYNIFEYTTISDKVCLSYEITCELA